MLVFFVIFVLATLGVIFAKSDSRWYIVLCSVTLATLYLFFEPLEEFDLYRHYEIFSYVEGLEWAELFELNEEYNTSFVALLYNIYLESSPAYIVFLFGLSRFGGAKLLIFVTTLLVYGIPMYIVYSAGKKNGTDNVSINASIIFLLFMINYLDVSGIRNMLAVSIVLLAVYWELVLKKKRILSFFLYVIGILIHNSVCILLLLRLLVLIKNKIWKTLAFLGVVAIIPVALLLHNEGVDFSRLGYVGYCR